MKTNSSERRQLIQIFMLPAELKLRLDLRPKSNLTIRLRTIAAHLVVLKPADKPAYSTRNPMLPRQLLIIHKELAEASFISLKED